MQGDQATAAVEGCWNLGGLRQNLKHCGSILEWPAPPIGAGAGFNALVQEIMCMATFFGILLLAAIIAGLWFLFDDIGRDYDWSEHGKSRKHDNDDSGSSDIGYKWTLGYDPKTGESGWHWE
jgi:hypothetical protein